MTIELTIAHHPGGKGPINLLGLFGFWVLFQYGFGRILPCSPGHSANKTAADVARSEVEELQPRPCTSENDTAWENDRVREAPLGSFFFPCHWRVAQLA